MYGDFCEQYAPKVEKTENSYICKIDAFNCDDDCSKCSNAESVNKNIAVIRTCLKIMRAFGNDKSKTDAESALKWFDGQFLYK